MQNLITKINEHNSYLKIITERSLAFCRSVSHRDTAEAAAATSDREVKTKGGPVHTLFRPVKVVCKQMSRRYVINWQKSETRLIWFAKEIHF